MRRLALISSVVLPEPPKFLLMSAGQLTLSGGAPGIRFPISPSSASLLLSASSPTLGISPGFSPAAGSLSLATSTPITSIASGLTTTPAVGSIVLSPSTPVKSIAISIVPTVGSLSVSADAPTAVSADPFAVSDRYWRAYITSYNGSSGTGIEELEIHGTAGGTDQLTGGSASASSFFSGDTVTYAAAHVYDNNGSTEWLSRTNGVDFGEWWTFDAGSGNSITGVEAALSWNNATTTSAPKSVWFAHSSDNSTWKAAWGVTGSSSWSTTETRTFTNPKLDSTATHAYWAVLMSEPGTSSFILSELAMRSVASGSNLCSGGTPLGDGWTNLSNLFDGNSATNTIKDAGCGFAGYHFASPVNILEIALTVGSGFSLPAPGHVSIMCSDDGLSWSNAWSATASSWGSGETKVFTKP